MRLRTGIAVVAVMALASCAGDGTPSTASTDPSTSAALASASAEPVGPERLPSGKDLMEVTAGPYLTPDGFAPELRLDIPGGWTSVHRAADAFDLGMPDPDRDAPLLAVVFMTPAEGNAADALAAVEQRATGRVRAVRASIGPIKAKAIDVTGGRGELVASAARGIALDAAPGQRVRVLAADVDGAPLVVVVLVPDGDGWATGWAAARELLDGVSGA